MPPAKQAAETAGTIEVVAHDTLHTGKRPEDRVPHGTKIKLPADTAERLLKSGAVRRPRETPSAGQPRPEGADLIAAIAAEIPKLDEAEEFNAEGKPSLRALADRLGYDISAAERDQAFEAAIAAAEKANGKKGGNGKK